MTPTAERRDASPPAGAVQGGESSPGFRRLPLGLRLYLAACAPALLLLGGALLAQPAPHDGALLALLLAGTVAAACCKLELTVFHARMSLVFAIGCLAILLLGVQAAVLCAAIGAVITTLVRPAKPGTLPQLQKQPLYRFYFNAALCALACGSAGLIYQLALRAAPAGEVGRLCALFVFAAVYFVANSAGLAVALALQQGLNPCVVWYENLLCTAPGFFASALAVWAIALAFRDLGAWALLLAAPLYVLYYSYWLYLDRLRRADQERDQRVRAEASRAEADLARQRMAFLAEASAQLAASLDYRATVVEVARLAVPFLADAAAFYLLSKDGELQLTAHAGPWHDQAPPAAGSSASALPDAPSALYDVVRLGEGVSREGRLREILPRPDLDGAAEIAPDLSGGLLCLPIATGGRTIGVLALFSREAPVENLPARTALAEELARRVAIAVDNAQLYARLQEEDRRKELFLALLGHELRNPLAAMCSALDLIAHRKLAIPELSSPVDILRRQVAHQKRMIDDLLDVSRINEGKLRLRMERVDLGSLAVRAARDLQSQAAVQGLEVITVPSEGPLWADADATRMEQILSNLLTNAVKYNSPGGRIRLSWGREEGEAVLRVQDTGVGIAAEMLPRVFEPFTQVETALHRSSGGLGLGLSLVRSLVELHGGRVSAASAGAGQGAEFTVSLPLQDPPPGAGSPTGELEGPGGVPERVPARALPQQQPLRILLADDNKDVAASLAEVLELWGHQVRVAQGGREALRAAAEAEWDAAIVDIGMPDLDGYQVARQLRGRPDGDRLFLLALTGCGQMQDQESARAAGFDVHLTKPASVARLEDTLQAARQHKLAWAAAH